MLPPSDGTLPFSSSLARVLRIPTDPANPEIAGADATVPSALPKRSIGRFVLMWVVGIALVGWLISRTNVAEVGRALGQANYFWLILGMLGNLLIPLWRSERFRALYELSGRQLELACCFGQYRLVKAVLPVGVGDYLFLKMIQKRGIISNIGEAVPRWVFLGLGDLTASFGLIAVTALWIRFDPALNLHVNIARAVAGGVCGGILLGLMILRKLPPAPQKPKTGFLAERLWELRRGLDGLHQPLTLTYMFGWSLFLWVWQIVCTLIQFQAFHLELSFVHLWAVSVLIMAIASFPIHAPMGIGTMHAVQVGILQAFGVPTPVGLAAAIGIQGAVILTTFLQAGIGTVLLAWHDRRAASAALISTPLSKKLPL